MGLGWYLRNNIDVRDIIRLACALPLLPQADIRQAFYIIVEEANRAGQGIGNIVRPFLLYVRDFWINDNSRLQWMSVHGSFHRTNNACESHNRVLRDLIGRHQNIFRFLGLYDSTCEIYFQATLNVLSSSLSFADGLVTLEGEAWADLLILQDAEHAAGRPRSVTAIVNDRVVERLEEDLRNPVGPRRDALLNFLQAASHRLENIIDNALDEHRV